MPHFVPPWLLTERPRSNLKTIRNLVMSLLDKILTKKPAAVSPAARFESDLDQIIADAISRGININTLIGVLESREQSARSRLVTTYRFGPAFECGNLPE
jgi:hypothetical protein